MLTPIIDESLIKRMRRPLERAQRVAIVCHMTPDGDAMGSSLALWHVLCALGKEPTVIMPDAPVDNLRTLPGASEAIDATRYPEFAAKLIAEADMVMCLDFNEPRRAGGLADALRETKAFKVMIDHHEGPDDFCDVTVSYAKLSSTCYLMFRVLCRLELFNYIDRSAAECLLAGMMTDTGNFAYNDSDPEIFVVVAELMRKGANKQRLYKTLFDTCSANCLRLNAYAISKHMRIFDGMGAALITLTREELNHYHYVKGDTEGLVNKPLAVPGVVYSAFMREESDYVKVSMRSVGAFPVNELCRQYFGGGGHINAAGGEFKGTLDEAVKLFESLLEENKRRYINQEKKD